MKETLKNMVTGFLFFLGIFIGVPLAFVLFPIWGTIGGMFIVGDIYNDKKMEKSSRVESLTLAGIGIPGLVAFTYWVDTAIWTTYAWRLGL